VRGARFTVELPAATKAQIGKSPAKATLGGADD
jgi:hypothetical protein